MQDSDIKMIRAELERAHRLAEAGQLHLAVQSFALLRSMVVERTSPLALRDALTKQRETLEAQRETFRATLMMSDIKGAPLLILADGSADAGPLQGHDVTYPWLLGNSPHTRRVDCISQSNFTTDDILAILTQTPTLGANSDVLLHIGRNDYEQQFLQESEQLAIGLLPEDLSDYLSEFTKKYQHHIISSQAEKNHLPCDRFRRNLEHILWQLRARRARKIVVAAILLPNQSVLTNNLKTYNLEILRAAERHEGLFLDFNRTAWQNSTDGGAMENSGHLTQSSHIHFAQKVADLLSSKPNVSGSSITSVPSIPMPATPALQLQEASMTRRKAILHIGTMKTGTSSIQATLGQNPIWLDQHNFTFFAGSQRTPEQVDRRVNSIKKDSNLIISDEGLWHFANSDRSNTSEIAKVLKDFDVTVLVYFRRPDEFIESWFSQGLKNGKGASSFKEFEASAFVRAGCSFYRRLQIFADLFGESAIRIAPYERAQLLQGDIVIDFLNRVGLAQSDDTNETLTASGLKLTPKQNISPDPNVILLTNLLRRLGHIPEDALSHVLKAVPNTLGDPAMTRGPKLRILRHQEIETINSRYLPVFRKLQAKYGGGRSPDFFLNWHPKADASTECSVRPLYDRLMDSPSPQTVSLVGTVPVQPTDTALPPALRVVFVIQKLAGLSGGAERILIETAEAMAARGMTVRIVSFDPESAVATYGRGQLPIRSLFPLRRAQDAARTKAGAGWAIGLLKALPNVFPVTHLKWQASHGLFARALHRDLTDHPADVVVAFLPPAITAAVHGAEGLNIPVIASTHNVPELDFGDGPRWDQNPLYRKRTVQALARAARITVLLPEFKAWFPKAVLPRVVQMPNPVSRLAAPKLGTKRSHVIMGVGRLTPIKRWDILISAFALAAPKLPGWQLHLFGEGPEQTRLQALIDQLGVSGQARLMGTTTTIAAEYDKAAVLAHPSEFEGFGLSVAEAMAHGAPAVAFAECSGVNSLIQDGENGLLVPREAEPVAGLADCLIRLAKDEALRLKLGNSATEITKRFDRDAIHDRWAALLREVAET